MKKKRYSYKELENTLAHALKAYGFKGHAHKTARELTEAAKNIGYPPIPEKILFGHDTDVILDEVDWSQKRMDSFINAQKKAKVNFATYLDAAMDVKGFGPFRYGNIGMMLGGKKTPKTMKKIIKLQSPKKQGYIDLHAGRPKGIGNWAVHKFEEEVDFETMKRLLDSYSYIPEK